MREIETQVCDLCENHDDYAPYTCPICKRDMCDACKEVSHKFSKGWSYGGTAYICSECWESDKEEIRLLKKIEDKRNRANELYENLRKSASRDCTTLVALNPDTFKSYQWIKDRKDRY